MKNIPLYALVVMVGPSGSGKTTIANKHFQKHEIISSDDIREDLLGDFRRQDYNNVVFKELFHRANLKLSLKRRVVIDATNLKTNDRKGIIELGKRHNVPIFYVVVNRTLEEKLETAGWRNEVPYLINKHHETFLQNEREILKGDGVATVIDTRKELFTVVKNSTNDNILDIIKSNGQKYIFAIGDVHSDIQALTSVIEWATARNAFMVFLGDIIDYGDNPIECINIVYDLIVSGKAVMCLGNHEDKIHRWLQKRDDAENKMKLSHGNMATIDRIMELNDSERDLIISKFDTIYEYSKNHWVIGNTLFTHGACNLNMFNSNSSKLSGEAKNLSLYGEVDRNVPFEENRYPTRLYNWCDTIPDGKRVIVGHDVRSTISPFVHKNEQGGEVIFADTGCSKEGVLSSVCLKVTGETLIVESMIKHS